MTCVHHWLCEKPKDGKVEAVCKKCDERRIFIQPMITRDDFRISTKEKDYELPI